MDYPNHLSPDQNARPGIFTISPSRSPARAQAPFSFAIPTTNSLAFDSTTRVTSLVAGGALPCIPSSSRRMIPRNELELSRPAIARAEKDTDEPSDSTGGRRRVSRRIHSSTPSTLTRLFAVQAPTTSPPVSRGPSYNHPTEELTEYPKATRPDTLHLHFYARGLLDGKYSDITVNVFDKAYELHRLVLDQAPFFASALSEPWLEATAKGITLHPEEIDPNITSLSFELALKRLYGCPDLAEEARVSLNMFAIGCWLEMEDLVEFSVEALLLRMRPRALASIINVVTNNYYGKHGTRVLGTCKSMLNRDGWLMPIRYWDSISSEVIRDVVGGDSFFVYSEWRRWLFVKRLLNRRLKATASELTTTLPSSSGATYRAPAAIRAQAPRKSLGSADPVVDPELTTWISLYEHAEITPLLELLDCGIHYMHFNFEQLQYVRSSRDVFGVPLVSEKIISDALWTALELRQSIVNARDLQDSLGFTDPANFATERSPDESLSEYQRVTLPQQESHQSQSLSILPAPAESKYVTTSPTSPTSPSSSSTERSGRRFWIPTVDCNIVTGGPEAVVTLSTTTEHTQGTSRSHPVPGSNNNVPRQSAYTHYPPFRFSAEIPHPRFIKDDRRLYSRTVFYAGSLWNIFVQKKRSSPGRTPQVGVYMYRAREQDNTDDVGLHYGSVDERIGALERELNFRNNSRSAEVTLETNPAPSAATASALSTFMTGSRQHPPHIQSSRQEPTDTTQLDDDSHDYAASSSSSEDDHIADDYLHNLTNSPGNAALPPYVDSRPVVKTYYRIYCPSQSGRVLSVYESAPDSFKFCQSRGWKCNSLMMEDDEVGEGVVEESGGGLEEGDEMQAEWAVGSEGGSGNGVGAGGGKRRTAARLRLTVVLGVV